MNFFDGLSAEGKSLLGVLDNRLAKIRKYKLQLEITHRPAFADELTEIELPHVYTSKANANLVHELYANLDDESLRLVIRDHFKTDPLGTIEKVFVRWIYV